MGDRQYLVGLPVVVTVTDEGAVTYDIDTAEAGVAIRDAYPDGDPPGDADPKVWLRAEEDQVERDAAAVDADHDKKNTEMKENA